MISFLKKFLKPKEEIVNFSEIDKWLDSHNSEFDTLKENLKELEMLKLEIFENLKILEKVDVTQSKVEDRVKHVVKGNLPAYTNALSIFLRKMITPKEADVTRLETFCSTFEREFDSLNKRTFRNFQIIKELVGKELEDVARSVKSLELLVKELKKSSEKVKGIIDLKENAKLIENNLNSKEKNEQKRQELQNHKEELLESCKRISKELENLKCSKTAKDLENLKSDEKKISDNLKVLENNLVTLFSPLQKALKKYNNICFIKKVGSYLENPVETLLNDSGMEILKFLNDVKNMVEDEKIDLKDDKKKKTVETLERIDESFIKEFISEHSSLKKELASVQREIKINSLPKEIIELEKEINLCMFKIENVDREINKIKDLDINSEIAMLERKLSEVLGFKVKVENVMG
ncbi:MAG: hypothetical protein Q8O03_05300 [Nanoarchaeota archaeon]|nr:hypothetical protein [Nanoarchaeota archaeon]